MISITPLEFKNNGRNTNLLISVFQISCFEQDVVDSKRDYTGRANQVKKTKELKEHSQS